MSGHVCEFCSGRVECFANHMCYTVTPDARDARAVPVAELRRQTGDRTLNQADHHPGGIVRLAPACDVLPQGAWTRGTVHPDVGVLAGLSEAPTRFQPPSQIAQTMVTLLLTTISIALGLAAMGHL